MKKKVLTPLLILMVIIVWGTIIYKVVGALNADDDMAGNFREAPKKAAFNDFTVHADSGKLALDYPDPFFTAEREERADTSTRNQVAPPVIRTRVVEAIRGTSAVNWDNIRYLGFIRNPAAHKLFAVISVGNEQSIIAEGEQFNGLKLVRNFRDSVTVNYAGLKRNIKISRSVQ